jgi:DNA-binding protein YbaB
MDSMGNFKNAQKVGQLTQNLVQDLSRTMSEGTAADGRVRVVLDGQQRPVSVKIDPSYFEVMLPASATVATAAGGGEAGGASSSSTDDASLFAEELSSAITAAMQRAHAKSVESIDEKMKSLYNELGIPSSK